MSSAPAASKPAAAAPAKAAKLRYYDDDDSDEQYLAADVKRKANWKSNPLVPLGAFGGAVALGAAYFFIRKGAGHNASQTMMQARVAAQAACVAGLIGFGAYHALKKEEDDE